ncbi:MAG: hypothetical protein H0W89_04345 [Candidatus Levybacteria bacterium]|nr:hypothetical protein [Candidatus Levybacteria bacterium]
MRKFTVKNRQKRKYTKKSAPQEVYRVSKIWSVSLLPLLIVVVAFLTTMLINLNLRETTVSSAPQINIPEISVTFSIEEVVKPFQSLPNLFNQPVAFLMSLGVLALGGLSNGATFLENVLVYSLSFLDPRPGLVNVGNTFAAFTLGIKTVVMLTLNWLNSTASLLVQSVLLIMTNIATGTQAIISVNIDYAGHGVEMIAASVSFVIEKVAWIFSVIFDAITGVLLFIFEKITAFINGVIRIIFIPFTILGAFWEQIKSPVMLLGFYIQMAGVDLTRSFESFGKLASVLSK